MQLHFYVPDEVADAIRRRAASAGMPVSKFVAELVTREVSRGWPKGYFESVVGSWAGPLERPPQGKLEKRDRL